MEQISLALHRHLFLLIVLFFALSMGCSACVGNPPHDQVAIQAVLDAEAKGVVDRNLDGLMSLWCDGGIVRDAKHTPNDPSDDVLWQGKDAIAQRYLHLVFPGEPHLLEHSIVHISWKDDAHEAVVLLSTRINSEAAISGDKWILCWQKGHWQVKETTYNLEPMP